MSEETGSPDKPASRFVRFMDYIETSRIQVHLFVFIGFGIPPAFILLMPFHCLSDIAARLAPFVVVVAAIAVLGNVASLPEFAARKFLRVRLDSWGKTFRFLAASATFWVAVFTLIVGTANDWGGGGGSSGCW